jgi:hypothetical protein
MFPLLAAVAVVALLAMGGSASAAPSGDRKKTLEPGKRWLLDVSFSEQPNHVQFGDILRNVYDGVESIRWLTTTRANVVVLPKVATTVDVGVPSGKFTITSVSEAPPAKAA